MKALGNYIYCLQEKNKKVGSLYLAADSQESKKEAKVLEIGNEVTSVKKDDVIVFDMSCGSIYKDTDEGRYLFVSESEVLGVVDDK